MDRYKSRKFILSLVSAGVSAWALSRGLVTGDQFVTLFLGTVGVYITGNVLQHTLAKTGTTS